VITVMDVTELAEQTAQETAETAGQTVQQAGQAADGATQAVGGLFVDSGSRDQDSEGLARGGVEGERLAERGW
jgi:hypothetical protein